MSVRQAAGDSWRWLSTRFPTAAMPRRSARRGEPTSAHSLASSQTVRSDLVEHPPFALPHASGFPILRAS